MLLRPPTPRCTVVGGRRQCCSDAPLLVSTPRAEPSLPPPHCRGGSIVPISHHDQPLRSRTQDHQGKATLFEWKRLVVCVVCAVCAACCVLRDVFCAFSPLSAAPPSAGPPKISLFFSPSPATCSLFLFLSGCLLVEFWWFL